MSTADPIDAPLFRLLVAADDETGIREPSRLMVDKVATVARSKLGERVGRLSDEDMMRLDRALLVFLGLAGRCPGVPGQFSGRSGQCRSDRA